MTAGRRARTIPLSGGLALVAGCALLAAVAARALEPRRDRLRQEACRSNLGLIGQALHAYHQAHGCFPPAYVADARGRPMHSWRLLILPYAGQRALHDAYRLDEPWDGPHNIKLVPRAPEFYRCPAHVEAAPPGHTAYKVVVGKGTLFPGAGSASLPEVTCGADQALAVVEVLNGEVPWTAPLDLERDRLDLTINDHRRSLGYPPREGVVGRHHAGMDVHFRDATTLSDLGANELYADGHVEHSRVVLAPPAIEKSPLIKKPRTYVHY